MLERVSDLLPSLRVFFLVEARLHVHENHATPFPQLLVDVGFAAPTFLQSDLPHHVVGSPLESLTCRALVGLVTTLTANNPPQPHTGEKEKDGY